MKLGYTIAVLAAITASAVNAQHVTRPLQPRAPGMPMKAHAQALPAEAAGSLKLGGAVVFGEDFANGLAGNNGIGAWTTSGPDGAIWMGDSDGPNGDFSDVSEIITSVTAGNGFMMFDSNVSNPGGVGTNRVGAVVSPLLDLSGTPRVHIEFEQAIRWCCVQETTHWLEVSTDGGATWPTRFDLVNNVTINTDIHVNEVIGTTKQRIDLAAAIAPNPSNVKLRFNHECYNCVAPGSVSHYFWQIDDVNIVESYQTDAALISTQYDQYPDQGDADLEYTVYPFDQARELNLRAHIRNAGAASLTNVTLNAEVVGSGGSVFNQSASLANLAAGVRDSITVNGFTPAATADVYTVNFTLSADQTDSLLTDNTNSKSFEVDPFIYGLDDGSLTDRLDNSGEAYLMGNVFWLENDATLYAIDVCVAGPAAGQPGSGTTVGAEIMAQILDANLDPIDFTDGHTVVSANLTGNNQAKWIHMVFSSPVVLTGQSDYVAVIQHLGGTDNVVTAISGWSVPQTSFVFDDAQATWFWQSQTPMVRMNFDAGVGIEEDAAREIALRAAPSVFTDNTTVRFLHEGGNASWSLLDLSGRVIRTADLGTLGAGNQSITVDGNGLAAGPYMVRVVSNGAAASVKLLKAAR
ncbi:MAG: T9SS type A sorting domain-containing protein [Flavobacteriales bacterium]